MKDPESPSISGTSDAAATLTRGQLLDVLLDVEAALRALVRSVFSSPNPEWTARIPRSVREDLERARERESGDIWSPVHRTELLD